MKQKTKYIYERLSILSQSKWLVILALFSILALFTLIKVEYFEMNFTGHHAMKYNSYVEPAKYMSKKLDFTWYQKKYLSDPISNPEGTYEKLPQLPILEWTLASTYMLLPQNSIELNTRLVMHTVGIILLVSTFLLTREWTNDFFGLIATILMATNQIVVFSTYVTVYDSITFTILLIVLYLYTKYLREKKSYFNLFLASLLIGIGLSIKISFLIWLLPITRIFTIYKERSLPNQIYYLTLLYIFSPIVFLTTKYSIPQASTNPINSLQVFIGGLLLTITTYFLIRTHKEKLLSVFDILQSRKLLIPATGILCIFIIMVGLEFFVSENIIKNFLTDSRLLFNPSLYVYMIRNQFIQYTTEPLFYAGVLGILLSVFSKNKKLRVFILSFLFTSVFFWIVASKSIFPHSYYTLIIIFTIILGVTALLYFVIRIFKNTYIKIFLVLIFLFLMIPTAIKNSQGMLGYQIAEFREAAKYLEEKTDEDELYIDENYTLSLTIATDRGRVGKIEDLYQSTEFVSSIKEFGFKYTMEKYNIKYLITYGDYPNYENYVDLFTEDLKGTTKPDRGQIILNIVDPDKYPLFEDLDERIAFIEDNNIKEKFIFEKQIGIYRFFRFSD